LPRLKHCANVIVDGKDKNAEASARQLRDLS